MTDQSGKLAAVLSMHEDPDAAREHLESMGVEELLVVLTRCDLDDAVVEPPEET